MNAGKSCLLISLYHALLQNQAGRVGVFKSIVDDRAANAISTRAPLELATTAVIHPATDLDALCGDFDYILIDEVQFITVSQVEQLRTLADAGKSVYCFGLSTNWKSELFVASRRLFELADEIVKAGVIPNMCTHCRQRPAILHRKLTATSAEVEIGGFEVYQWRCWTCFRE